MYIPLPLPLRLHHVSFSLPSRPSCLPLPLTPASLSHSLSLCLSISLSTIFPPSPSLLPLSLSHPSHSPFPPFLPPAPFFLVCSFLWLALYLCDVVRVSFFVLTPCLSSFLFVSLSLSLSRYSLLVPLHAAPSPLRPQRAFRGRGCGMEGDKRRMPRER